MPAEINDDKAPHVIHFILSLLKNHRCTHPDTPFFIGLNGVQGAGKTVLVTLLQTTLESPPHDLPTVVFSLDDCYLTHADQVALAQAYPHNPLLQHRGQPSTHDVPLALSVFNSLKANKPTKIPAYNKAAFNGQGDRVPSTEWKEVNTDPAHPIRIVIFEGWSVGFHSLPVHTLEQKHSEAVVAVEKSGANYKGRLGHNYLESVCNINEALRKYDEIWTYFDAFIHIDAADPLFVYKWRLEQEHGLREKGGGAMSDEEVKNFVDGYYPAYELYTDTLRTGVFRPDDDGEAQGEEWQGRQLRIVVGEDRKVTEVIKI